jgi:hypothetical protein
MSSTMLRKINKKKKTQKNNPQPHIPIILLIVDVFAKQLERSVEDTRHVDGQTHLSAVVLPLDVANHLVEKCLVCLPSYARE